MIYEKKLKNEIELENVKYLADVDVQL